MTLSTQVEEVVRPAEERWRAGRWVLTHEDWVALCRVLGQLEWLRPTRLAATPALAERTTRLQAVAGDLACAALATHGDLAWMLSECASALQLVLCPSGLRKVQWPAGMGNVHEHQLTPVEASEAETAVGHVWFFLDVAEAQCSWT